MIGLTVEFPLDIASNGIGTVTAYNEQTGKITVIDDDNLKWQGDEYQVIVLDELP